MPDTDTIPDYAPLQAAYHRAFEDTLRGLVSSVPWPQEPATVLDVACGNGIYTRWLAERGGPLARVTAIDMASSWFQQGDAPHDGAVAGPENGSHGQRRGVLAAIRFVRGNAESLPFADDRFDVVWCAQSLYSLPHTATALEEMVRVARPGGIVAVLENDTLHHLLLPWPIELELAVRMAEYQALASQSGYPSRFYVGRRLHVLLRQAGLGELVDKAWTTNRQSPLGPHDREFLTHYFSDLRQRVASRLPPERLERLERLITPGGPEFLLDSPALTITSIDRMVWGRKPRR